MARLDRQSVWSLGGIDIRLIPLEVLIQMINISIDNCREKLQNYPMKIKIGERINRIKIRKILSLKDCEYECECGKIKTGSVYAIRDGRIKSCGCLKTETINKIRTTHGATKKNSINFSEYISWQSMKKRCLNPNYHTFHRYGGRGIKVCERWLCKVGFQNFMDDMGKSCGLTLDRINNDGNYEPENCRWATRAIQSQNSSRPKLLDFNGEIKSISQWSRVLEIPRTTISSRLKRGLKIKMVLHDKNIV